MASPAGPKDDDSQCERVYERTLTLTLADARYNNIIIYGVKTSRVGDYTAFQEIIIILRSAEWRDVAQNSREVMQLVASPNVIEELVNSLFNDYYILWAPA